MGIPTEGYGFSNDATALLGAPSFSAAGFFYDGEGSGADNQPALLSAVCLPYHPETSKKKVIYDRLSKYGLYYMTVEARPGKCF